MEGRSEVVLRSHVRELGTVEFEHHGWSVVRLVCGGAINTKENRA